jgi:hypothetical protein
LMINSLSFNWAVFFDFIHPILKREYISTISIWPITKVLY